jgi:CHAT domain-containing protein
MDLRGVDLAVLSACDTGRGEIAVGEGVFGLRRAFDVAGASTVVMSLWPVPDDAARAWMSEFYPAIRDGVGAPAAARAASLARLAALREAGIAPHPELWSGFIAVGDWH